MLSFRSRSVVVALLFVPTAALAQIKVGPTSVQGSETIPTPIGPATVSGSFDWKKGTWSNDGSWALMDDDGGAKVTWKCGSETTCKYTFTRTFADESFWSLLGDNGQYTADWKLKLPEDSVLAGFLRYEEDANLVGCFDLSKGKWGAKATYDAEAERLQAIFNAPEFNLEFRLDDYLYGRGKFDHVGKVGDQETKTSILYEIDEQKKTQQVCFVHSKGKDIFSSVTANSTDGRDSLLGTFRRHGFEASFQAGEDVDQFGRFSFKSPTNKHEYWGRFESPVKGPDEAQIGIDIPNLLSGSLSGLVNGSFNTNVKFTSAHNFTLTYHGNAVGEHEAAFDCLLREDDNNKLNVKVACRRKPGGPFTYDMGVQGSFQPTMTTTCTGSGSFFQKEDGTTGVKLDVTLGRPENSQVRCSMELGESRQPTWNFEIDIARWPPARHK